MPLKEFNTYIIHHLACESPYFCAKYDDASATHSIYISYFVLVHMTFSWNIIQRGHRGDWTEFISSFQSK